MTPPTPPSPSPSPSQVQTSTSTSFLTPTSPKHHNRSPTDRSRCAQEFHLRYQQRRRQRERLRRKEKEKETETEMESDSNMYLPIPDHEIEQLDEEEEPIELRYKRGQWADSDTESTTTDDSSSAGLGINFYDHLGVGRRRVVFEKLKTRDLEEVFGKENDGREGWKDDNEEEENGYEARNVLYQQGKPIGKPNHKSTYASQLTSNGRTLRAQFQQQEHQQQTPSVSSVYSSTPKTYQSSPGPLKSPDINLELLTPKLLAPIEDPDWDHDSPLDLIDQYLEHNYREQAETFVRIASRETPVRALSGSKRAVSSNSAGSGSCPRSNRNCEERRRSVLGLSVNGLDNADADGDVGVVDPPSQSPRPEGAGAVSSNTNSHDDDETSSSPSLALISYEEGQKESDLESLSKSQLVQKGQQSTLTDSTSSSSSLSIPVQPSSRIQRAINLREQRTGSGFSPSVSLPSRSPSSPSTLGTSPFTLRHSGSTLRILLHSASKPTIVKRSARPFSSTTNSTSTTYISRTQSQTSVVRGPEYFTVEERLHITRLVHATARSCKRHTNCKDCIDTEYAYYENKLLPRSMDPEQRQKIINNNRSLRNIKNELESLAEHGAISDEAYDTIMAALPAESSLGGSSARSNPTPVQAQAPAPAPVPTNAFNNMRLNDPPPPAYTTPVAPSVPNRAPSAPPAKPEIARATALYRYAEPDDCTFEPGDQIVVHEYMNNDWWLGRNLRTGKEGVFPVNYVQVIPSQPQGPPTMHGAYGNEKANYNNAYPGQYQPQQGPPPPGPSNPYNSSVPPMAIAEEPSKPGKGQEMGKKFGKKLGNAAIFGAGATIGGNIVNSIF
ncbi:hypothetical protein BKA64DRAFT_742610 [Cadophora sp. MPI-SDFR-AT-0126]|nr:hypothetical protein BKA64DRAFT_742610 [Leotiomycetes sp. MPI-SDFR-AT-0126]